MDEIKVDCNIGLACYNPNFKLVVNSTNKTKKYKPTKPIKSLEERSKEVENISNQFLELGISMEYPGTQEFFKICKEFQINAISASGTIKFPVYNRLMRYIFSTQPHVTSRMILEHVAQKQQNKNSISLVSESDKN